MPNCLLTRLSLPLSSWVCSSCLGPKQQERHIRHRTTPRPSSAVYSWHQGEGWCRKCQDKTRLGLIPLHKRRRDQRLRLLMRILEVAKEEHHSTLSESYNEIMKQPATTMTTRSQTRGIPATFRTKNTQYHNSFFPWTIRDLKGQSEQTISHRSIKVTIARPDLSALIPL